MRISAMRTVLEVPSVKLVILLSHGFPGLPPFQPKGALPGMAGLVAPPDGKWLAFGGTLGDLNLLETARFGQHGKTRHLDGHRTPSSSGLWDVVFALVFAPDSKTLYSTGGDGMIRAWNVATGKELRSFG